MNPSATHAAPKACGLAVTSLVCGCLGFLTFFITGIPAIITGHLALGKIKRSAGTIGGSGAATTGLILGYVTSAMSLVVIALAALATPAIYQALERANMAENVNNVRQLHLASMSYAMDNDGKFPPDLQILETDGYIHRLDDLRYTERKTKTKHDWVYAAGHSDTDDPSIILFAAPMTTSDGSKRVVGSLDGSARPLREIEFRRQIREPQNAGLPAP